MSIKNNLLILFTCVLGLGFGYSISSLWSSANGSASLSGSTSLSSRHPLHIEKHLAVVKTSIEQVGKIATGPEEETELIGRISLQQPVEQNVSYEWLLPPGVTLVDGLPSAQLSTIPEGHSAEVRILVRGFTGENQKLVTLQAHVVKDGIRFGNSAVISSRPEDSMEAVATKMKARADQLRPKAKDTRSE